MSRKKEQAPVQADAAVDPSAPQESLPQVSDAITRDDVKEMLRRASRIIGVFARQTPTKLDDLAAKVFAKAAEGWRSGGRRL